MRSKESCCSKLTNLFTNSEPVILVKNVLSITCQVQKHNFSFRFPQDTSPEPKAEADSGVTQSLTQTFGGGSHGQG